MNPPDVYDAEGHPYDRRRGTRREDDVPEEVARGWELWAKLMFMHRGKVIGVAMAVASLVSYSLTALGMRYVGPRQDIQAVERKVDTLAARVSRVEDKVQDGAADRADIKRTLAWVIYLNCMSVRRSDPDALPPICDTAKPLR